MAKKPETIDADVLESAEQRALEALQSISEEQFSLDSVLASLGDSDEKARVMLYRVGKTGEKDKYLRKFTPQEWLDYGQDGILYDYGGGSYRARVYDARSKLRANSGFELEEPRTRLAVAPYPARFADAAPIHSAPAQGADVLTAVNAMAQAMQNAMATAFDKIAVVIQAQPKREDFLRELALYKQLFAAPPAAPVVRSPEPLETFIKAVSFVKENLVPRDGETGPADVFMELARTFGPVIAEQSKKLAAATSVVPVAPAARPGAAHVPTRAIQPGPAASGTPAPALTPAEQTTEEQMDIQMKMAVGFLVQQAKNDSDPQTYAEMVIDTVDAEVIEQWRTQPADALISWLAEFDPEVASYSDWFREVHAAIVEMIAEENALPTVPAGSPEKPVDPLLTAADGASITGGTGETED